MGTPGAEVNSTVADPEEGAASAPPPPRSGSQKQRNDHISAEVLSRMCHLRPQTSKFFGEHAPGPLYI